MVKTYANATTNFQCYERSVTVKSMLEQRRQLVAAPLHLPGIVGEPHDCPSLATALEIPSVAVGRQVRHRGASITIGDIIIIQGEFSMVVLGIECNEFAGQLCESLAKVGSESPACTRLHNTSWRFVVNLNGTGEVFIAQAFAWDDRDVCVLHPRF